MKMTWQKKMMMKTTKNHFLQTGSTGSRKGIKNVKASIIQAKTGNGKGNYRYQKTSDTFNIACRAMRKGIRKKTLKRQNNLSALIPLRSLVEPFLMLKIKGIRISSLKRENIPDTYILSLVRSLDRAKVSYRK